MTFKKNNKNMFLFLLLFFSLMLNSVIISAAIKEKSTSQIVDTLPTLNLNKREVPLKWNGQDRKIIYLTIDDGPSKNTQTILDILNEYQVKATFFMIGTNVSRRPDAVQAVANNGHYIGLHTMSHDKNIIYNVNQPDALVNELIVLQDLLEPLIDSRPNLLRPPYGSDPGIKPVIADSLVRNDFKVWDWTIDTLDWRQKSVDGIMKAIEKQNTRAVEVLLIHEKDISVESLPSIIEYFKQKGYEFRTYNPRQHFMINLIHDERL